MECKNIILSMVCVSLLVGCKSIGPKVIEQSHPSYNNAIVDSMDREILTNLVRLRYRENPMFLEIVSINESRKNEFRAGFSDKTLYFPHGKASQHSFAPTMTFDASQSPTISYKPIRGKDFIKQLMTPIPLGAVLVMSQSGWNVRRTFNLCIDQINEVDNAHTAAGPTPNIMQEYKTFYRATYLLEQLENNGEVVLGLDPANRSSLVMLFKSNQDNKILDEFKSILGLAKNRNEFHFQNNFLNSNDGSSITIRTRSLMGVLFYLSNGVEVPQSDLHSGKVAKNVHLDNDIKSEGFSELAEMLKIHCSKTKPVDAFLEVFHREHWFYINDTDLVSKSTFMFISYLLNLQAGDNSAQSVAPMLTIPVK